MNKSTMWKWLLLIALTAWSMALVTPFKQKVKLGLDLKGGTSFTVEVDKNEVRKQILEGDAKLEGSALESAVQTLVKKTQGVALEVIRSRVDGLGIAEPEIYPLLDNRIVIRLPGVDVNKRIEAKNSIMSVAFLEFRLVHSESDAWVSELFNSGLTPRGFSAVRVGNEQYYVRDRKVVEDKALDRAFWEDLKRFGSKRGAEFMLEKETLKDGSVVYKPAYIEVRKQLTGSALKDARVEYDQYNRPYISLSFNKAGAERFGKVTAAYAPRGENNLNSETGRRLAIILDGKLYSAPTIQDAIYSGNAQITGSFTVDECTRLVNVLRAGALPAPVTIVEERTVDPSLGKDSIDSGMRACIYGAIAVVVFMAGYYLLAGVIADLSLLMLMLMLPFGMWFSSGILSLFSAGAGASAGLPVLTLPGIAGIVLTLGMAVDANVLIYERIREELALGKSVVSSISAGYDKAFATIFDSNLTTLVAAVIMFWQGSGSIRGFAVTLTAGILVSMLTALVFTRLLLDTLAAKTKLKTIKMFSFFPKTKIDFMGKRYIAIGLSWAIIIISWIILFHKGEKNFGVDFTGGTSITFAFDQKQPAEAVRAVLEKAGIKDAAIQYHGELGVAEGAKANETLEVKVSYENGNTAIDAVKTAFAAQGYKDIANDSVGPQIGQELKRKGAMSMILALVGITIYIAFRFEFGFAIGAIVATVHDVLITIGLYCLFGRELNLTIVAALLTIIGFSVNDTIVVFDRIRENIKLLHGTKASYAEISNLSINQTLSRTVLTSLTVVLTVISLLIFGGGAIFDFALTLLIGFTVGTYSSIYVATPVALLWHKEKKG
ncbi:MAG TPA: protein translocase subunit SecD [Pontiellaceae bacterium]|nr:protein translocase subunit SecD [Pontiellaceae bacterium]